MVFGNLIMCVCVCACVRVLYVLCVHPCVQPMWTGNVPRTWIRRTCTGSSRACRTTMRASFPSIIHTQGLFTRIHVCNLPCMSLFTYRNSSYYFDSMGSLDQICASASTWPMSIPTHTYILIRKNNKLILKHSIHTCTCEHTHTHTHTPDGLAARGRLWIPQPLSRRQQLPALPKQQCPPSPCTQLVCTNSMIYLIIANLVADLQYFFWGCHLIFELFNKLV